MTIHNHHRRLPIIVLLIALGASLGCSPHCMNDLEAVRLNRQAQRHLADGQADQAQHLLYMSLDCDFENAVSHYYLGRCFELEDRPEKAAYEYRLAIRFAPGMQQAHQALISVLAEHGADAESIDATRAFLELGLESTATLLDIADDFFSHQLDQQAVMILHKAAEQSPDNAAPWIALADYHARLSHHQQERQCLLKAKAADPYHPGLPGRLGEMGIRIDQ